MGGMDNSDYANRSSLSGTEGCHYAALVLFQDTTVTETQHKPSVSTTWLNYSDRNLQVRLPCQVVPPHVWPVVWPVLLPALILHPENKETISLDMSTACNRAEKTEFLIGLLCLGATEGDLHIWSAVHTLALLALVPLMRVEFLPVIPQPITEHATVKHALTNFQSIGK